MKFLLFTTILFCQKNFAQKSCDPTKLPVVFVHGFMGSGDNWSTQMQRFSSNEYCSDRLFVFDWNSFGGTNNSVLLKNFIDKVLVRTGASKIDLIAHSAGGRVCYDLLADSVNASKVAHYVHVGSFPMKQPAGKNGEVPTMNIYSSSDMVLRKGKDIPGAENVQLTGYDHLQTATGEKTFEAAFSFLTGHVPVSAGIIPTGNVENKVTVKGVMLGDNSVLAGDSVRVFAVDPRTGKRQPQKRSNTTYGRWMAFDDEGKMNISLLKDTYTEMELHVKGGRSLNYFFEPLKRGENNFYLRALPVSGLAATMLGKIPMDDRQTALVIFTANNAVIAGRDSLAIDSIPLSTPGLMPAEKTSVACFVYDDGDEITTGKGLRFLDAAPFISGADIFIKAEEHKTMRVYYNGRSIVLPKRKSRDTIMIVVFN
ncbi:MAG: alpha/beta fold hydrolase [Ferruginibacter sp.]